MIESNAAATCSPQFTVRANRDLAGKKINMLWMRCTLFIQDSRNYSTKKIDNFSNSE